MKESIHPFIYSIFSISSLVVKIAKKIVVGTLILQNWTFWSVKYLEGGHSAAKVRLRSTFGADFEMFQNLIKTIFNDTY